jgi:hypothetical protein
MTSQRAETDDPPRLRSRSRAGADRDPPDPIVEPDRPVPGSRPLRLAHGRP